MRSPVKTKLAQPVPELPVADVEKAQAYYRDVLGFEIAWIYPDKSIGAVVRDDTVIFLSRQNNLSPNRHWIFAVDVDATYEEMKLRNANITAEIEDKPWRLRQFTIQDLDSNRFTFHHDL